MDVTRARGWTGGRRQKHAAERNETAVKSRSSHRLQRCIELQQRPAL